MTAPFRDAAEPAFLSPEAQAATLWSFVHAKAPRFASAEALELVNGLGDIAHLEPSALARRLQEALSARRVVLKYTNALKVAAQILGHASYHALSVARAAPALLQLVSPAKWLNRPVRDWKEGIQHFCDFVEGDREGGSLHDIYQMGFTPTAVTIDTPRTTIHDEHGRAIPALQLQWSPQQSQLSAAVAGVETLRRRYEETGRAVVDGLAAAQFCLHGPHPEAHPDDPVNSELVVMEVTPGPSFGDEVARGDEVRCWSELEFVHPRDKLPSYALDGPTWVVDTRRYEWRLSTVRMEGLVPSIVHRPLTSAESAKLFRRHRNAVSNRRRLHPEDRVKALPSIAAATEQIELDAEQLRRFTANDFARALTKQKRVSAEMLINLAQVLELSDPSVLVRKPKRSELTLLRDDEMLRAFVSRVHDVVYEVPRRLSEEVVLQVDQAVDLMLSGLKMDVVLADGEVRDAFPRQPPYMVYANQGKDMLARLKQLGLVAYAGVFTTVTPFRARGVAERSIRSNSSFKIERLLFLDVDVAKLVE